MPVSYITDNAHSAARVLAPHIRRRSSASVSQSIASPFISHLTYDARTGEIALPPSPPLHAWDDKRSEKTGLGLYPGPKQAPLSAWSSSAPKGKAFSLPRPWYSALALGSITLTFIFLLSNMVPSASNSRATTLLARIRTGNKASCEPYSAFGTLQVDPHDADRNRWVPFDRTCQPPNFLAKLRDFALHDSPRVDPSAFSWLHNKTALLIGDSISREHVENFCQLMGEESEVVRPNHRWAAGPSPMRAPVKASHSIERPQRLNSRGYRVVRDASRPRICYIPKLDFLLVSVFHFGLDQEDYWRESRMPQYSSPGMFEHRLVDQITPLINHIRADGRRSAPDYVEITSGTWDLARWAEQDVLAQKPTEQALSQDRLTWYRFRVGQMMDKVRTAFPDAKAKVWRTLHYPTDQVAEFDYFMDKINPRTTNGSRGATEPPSFSHNRIHQLDQAVRSLVLPSASSAASSAVSTHSPSGLTDDLESDVPHPEFRLNEWGTILKGHEAHQKDRLHGDPLPGGYLWGDIMLHELYQGVQRANSKSSYY
ncbi:uncharacterized protein JCM15063_004510 [Sporobolomyces koalae]|uniref:uncharacterized protein n=1 Tax=Sporobolomyces koalae TaxID=500713 RepID=UPI0031733310